MIPIKTAAELDKMRKGGLILSLVFDLVERIIQDGVNAKEIDDLIKTEIVRNGAYPSFLGYRGYKYSSCISRNEEVVHGLPTSNKVFLVGDICSVDIGVHFMGFHVDAARTYPVGAISNENRSLIRVAKEAFFKALGKGFKGNMRIHDVEVLRDENGKPYINLHGKAKRSTELLGVNSIHISISHDVEYSVAVVILER